MESFKWGQQFVTDLPEVDSQHKKLVSMINGFSTAIAENRAEKDYLLTIFQDVSSYAQEHFDTERTLMVEMQLDNRHLKMHLKQHADFVTDVSNISQSIDLSSPDDARTLLEFLIHWLAFHILGIDKNMARQVTEIQNGMSPEEAYDKGERETSSSVAPLVAALSGLFGLISRRNKELVDLNQNLESRVAVRTEELVKANEKLEKVSITDHLTALPNRRFAMGQLKLLLEEVTLSARPLSCLMVDADGFKAINDTYGHDAGDVVLMRLAKELQHSVRSDDIVCRLGGDEFVIICPDTDLQGAVYLGEHTRKKVAALKVPTGQGYWHGSVSIGVASTTEEIKDTLTLLKAADEAVYEAKRCGRNCVKSQ